MIDMVVDITYMYKCVINFIRGMWFITTYWACGWLTPSNFSSFQILVMKHGMKTFSIRGMLRCNTRFEFRILASNLFIYYFHLYYLSIWWDKRKIEFYSILCNGLNISYSDFGQNVKPSLIRLGSVCLFVFFLW
jgi:hypothetical protein